MLRAMLAPGVPGLACLLASMAGTAAAGTLAVSDIGQGNVVLEVGESQVRELSGITRARGNDYFAVSDKSGSLYPLRIQVDPRTGFIREAKVGQAIPLEGGMDLEGVAYHPGGPSVFVSDELGPAIRENSVSDGSLLQSLELPKIYQRVRSDRSLESLAFDPDHGALWTVNEEATVKDGKKANVTLGSVVRIQRFGPNLTPAGQWAYVTEPIPGDTEPALSRNGVADMLVLPDGSLLTLERSLSEEGLGARIFAVDLTKASDVSGIASLKGASYIPASKTLLWELKSLTGIFEGMTLGPRLADGSYSLILVSDDGGLFQPSVYALRVKLSGG